MAYRIPKTIKKTFSNYAVESKAELEELSKLKILAYSGFYSKRIVKVTIKKNKKKLLLNYVFKDKNYYLKFIRNLRKICS